MPLPHRPQLRHAAHRARRRLDRESLWLITQSAVAAGVAWEVALQLPDHGRPFFAPIAAVIGLNADRGQRGRQAMNMMVGVALGILAGAAVVSLVGVGAWQLVVASMLTLVVTTAAGAPPLIRTQATASAILVVALHVPGTNLAAQRLIDALIGGGIAVIVARLLFPVDPVRLVRGQAAMLRTTLGRDLDDVATAIDIGSADAARRARQRLDEVDEGPLLDALTVARNVVRSAPRRRPLKRRFDALGAAWYELARTVTDARTIGSGAVRILSSERPVSGAAAHAVRAAADAVRAVQPDEARRRSEAARRAAELLLEEDSSLGASAIAHGVTSLADHAVSGAEARERAG